MHMLVRGVVGVTVTRVVGVCMSAHQLVPSLGFW
jgi:hypothetical protein